MVVPLVGDIPVEPGTGRRELRAAEVALEGERRLLPVVVAVLVEELDDLEVAEGGVGLPGAGCRTALADEPSDCRPAVAQVPRGRDAPTGDVVFVEIVLDETGIVLGIGQVAAEDVVDVAALAGGESGDADRETIAQAYVDVAAQVVAGLSFAGCIGAGVDLRAEAARIRLVGDDAQRAGLRTRAEERALRPRQRLDALDVHEPGIDLLRVGGERLFVEVDRRHAVGAVLRGSGGYAPEYHGVAARYGVHQRDARQRVDVLLHVAGAQAFEVVGGEGRDALRKVLHVGLALRCRDDDLLDHAPLRVDFLFCFLRKDGERRVRHHDGDGQRL